MMQAVLCCQKLCLQSTATLFSLNEPDSLWSLKIPQCASKKYRVVTLASWPNLPIVLCPSSWPPNHPYMSTDWTPLHQ